MELGFRGSAVLLIRRRIMVFLLLLVAFGGAVERILFLMSIASNGEAAERILLLRANLGELITLICSVSLVGMGRGDGFPRFRSPLHGVLELIHCMKW